MEFNKKEFDNFRNDLQQALKGIEEKYQVKINTGKIKYTELDFNIDMKVIKNEDGLNVEQEKFEKYCIIYGFKKEHYKNKITLQNKQFEFVGFNINKPKNSCSIREIGTGKLYQTTEETIKRALNIPLNSWE